jgi:hypothetical protein
VTLTGDRLSEEWIWPAFLEYQSPACCAWIRGKLD